MNQNDYWDNIPFGRTPGHINHVRVAPGSAQWPVVVESLCSTYCQISGVASARSVGRSGQGGNGRCCTQVGYTPADCCHIPADYYHNRVDCCHSRVGCIGHYSLTVLHFRVDRCRHGVADHSGCTIVGEHCRVDDILPPWQIGNVFQLSRRFPARWVKRLRFGRIRTSGFIGLGVS